VFENRPHPGLAMDSCPPPQRSADAYLCAQQPDAMCTSAPCCARAALAPVGMRFSQLPLRCLRGLHSLLSRLLRGSRP
jgi:hypothetical protein